MKKIKLFENCIPVKGAKRSIICDLQRSTYHFIPNTLYEILIRYDGKGINAIKEDFEKSEHFIIDEYINFLIEKEYIFLTSIPEQFPKINPTWDVPSLITNAIIDFDKNSDNKFSLIIKQLNELNCKACELRFFDTVSHEFLCNILNEINNTSITCVNIVIKYSTNINKKNIDKLFLEYKNINQILVHSAPSNFTYNNTKRNNLFFQSKPINSEKDCGCITPYNFVVNNDMFFESIKHNSCLNRKISIDKEGNIKNCPSSKTSFGHISTCSLIDALNNKNFKEMWKITKDQISVCKDCEFRYICTDCRVYVKDKLGKPLKCGYNPYTTEWNKID